MRELFQKIKLNALVTSLLYAAVGLILLVWPELSANILCTVVGLFLVVCGVVDILQFLLSRDGSLYTNAHLILGVILAVVGIWIMTLPDLISVVIPRVIGIILFVHGFGDIGDAMTLHKNGYARWGTALALAIVTLMLGALLVLDPFDAFATVVRMIGLFLLYDGISDLWITSRVSRTVKQAEKDAQARADAVDVEFKDIK